jgi:hypothetical protein
MFAVLLQATHDSDGVGFQLHLTGFTMHGCPYSGMVLSNTPSYGSCGNVTCAAIMHMLKQLAKKLNEHNETTTTSKKHWPNKLHLQMDNSGKYKPSKYIFRKTYFYFYSLYCR